jgi:putative sigma-54 modulation protein
VELVVKGKNLEVSARLREQTQEKIEKATRFLDRITAVEVEFSELRNPRASDGRSGVEVTVHTRHHVVRATASAPDPLSALDEASEKIERRLKKLKGKLRSRPSHQGNSVRSLASRELLAETLTVEGGGKPEPRIVRTKRFTIQSMAPEDAALHMDLLGHDFYLFRNLDTEQVNLVYRRTDGDLGLIEPAL